MNEIDDCEVYTFKEFVTTVKEGFLNDYDGFGKLYLKGIEDDFQPNTYIIIGPSDLSRLMVRWYNK